MMITTTRRSKMLRGTTRRMGAKRRMRKSRKRKILPSVVPLLQLFSLQ